MTYDPHPALLRRPATLCQLAGIYRGNIGDPAGTWCEPKVDGVRACWIDGELMSGREGVRMHGVGHIVAQLRRIEAAAGHPMFFDGEYQVDGDYRATMRHMGRKARAPQEGTLWLFDALPLDRWRADDDDQPLYARKQALTALVEPITREHGAGGLSWEWPAGSRGRAPAGDAVRLMPDEWLAGGAEVAARAAEVWAAGGEGLVLKDATAPYRRNRSNAWRKVKLEGWSTRKLAA